MSDSIYSVIAYIARYWFVLLAVVIIWRAIKWVRRDADYVSHTQKRLPDAGYIGEWAVVASDAAGIPPGLVMRASQDGWIGSARGCDIRLKDAGVPARAARFILREDGLHLFPQRRGILLVDGNDVSHEAILRHGATLTVGGVTLQLRLFAGVLLVGEAPASFMETDGRRRHKQPVYVAEVEDLYEDYYDDEDESEELTSDDEYDEEEYDGTPPKMALPRPNLTVRSRRHRRQ